MLKRKAYSYIRMSTDVQLKGDSLRRQLEASERYALDNNLELVDSIDGIPLKDIGVSGFLGKNTHKGVLAVFLEALQLGKIEPNSVLLIESLDRLSRDKLTEALTQFLNILDHGIEIVTLADNQRYTKEIINHNQGTLIISLTIMFRANEESEIKSKRVRAAWSNKRNNATNKPMTSRCPAWLRLVDGKFEVIPEKAVIVMRIFELCISTCGLYGIARYFNENKVPVIGTTEIWQRSYIHKIITSRAVLGELQPYTTINGKRHQPAGDPIPNYYPQIIDEDTFYRANAAIARRNKSGRGRKGKTFSNLFSGLVYCSHCGSRITVRNHAPYKPWGKRLCCTNQRVGGGCTMPEWRLDAFQSMLFRHIHEVNFEALLIEDQSNEKDLDDEIDVLNSKLANREKEFDRMCDFVMGDDLNPAAKKNFTQKLNIVQQEIDEIKGQIETKKLQKHEEAEARQMLGTTQLKRMLELIEENKDDYYFRSKVNQLLTKTIERIELIQDPFVFQEWDFTEDDREVKAFRKLNPHLNSESLRKLVSRKAFRDLCKMFSKRIVVKYRSGSKRTISFDLSLLHKPFPWSKRKVPQETT